MDGDEAGRKATEKLKKALKSVAMVWVIHMPDGKDLNDCTKEEFEQLYARRD
jgi:DNA primase